MTTNPVGSRRSAPPLTEQRIQQRLRGTVAPASTVAPADRKRPLPMSAGQRQMWVLHRMDPASTAYLMSWTLRLSGPLDTEALRWAWERLTHRHEILRTRYAQVGEDPVQVVDPPAPFELAPVDLTGEVDRAGRIAAVHRERAFDLRTEHPLRVTLLRCGPEVHLMVIVMHHIACDAASFQLIARELSALYRERVTGQSAGLTDPAMQYADFATWEQARVASGALRGHLEYWRRRLDGLGDLGLPTDRGRPARPDWRGGAVEIPIAAESAERVRTLASEYRTSPYTVLLAAYHAMLSSVSGNPDVAVGTPVTARILPEFDQLVGYGINTVVIRAQGAMDQSFASLLEQVRQRLLEALDHREAPFPMVVDELRPTREVATNPLFQVAFDLEPVEAGGFSLADLSVTELWPATATRSKFDLTLHLVQTPAGDLHASLEFARALFDDDTAQGFAAHYGQLLQRVLHDPHAPLADVAKVPEGWPRPAVAAPSGARPTPRHDEPATPGELARRDAVLAVLHGAWQEVLHVEKIDPDDNFFDVGGDSLRAVTLAGHLQTRGLQVSAADIFAHQTINELARVVPGEPHDREVSVGVAPFAMVSPADRDALPAGLADAYPVGAAQLGMIVEIRARPDRSRYQDTTSFHVRDDRPLVPAAFQAAAQLVVDRHEVLRTSFDLTGYTVPLQLVHRQAAIVAAVTDHGALGPDGWERLMRRYDEEQQLIPMDLMAAPLLRVHAHTAAGTTDWWLSITECHPILEGWSFHSLLMEIVTCYRDIRDGRTPAAPDPVMFRFADHIAAEQAAVSSAEDRAFWRGVVEARVPAELPSAWQGDRDVPEERYQHSVYLGDLGDALRALATRTSTSLKAVLLAAHLTVMSAVVARDDFFTGLVCDARPEIVGADRVPGMYLNTLPFACPRGARTWQDLIRQVYDGLTEMLPHRRYPMQLIQQETGHAGRLIEVMFNYLDFHQLDHDLFHLAETVDVTDNEFALHVFTLPGVLRLNTTSHALSRPAAERLGAMYRSVFEQMAGDPQGDPTTACLAAGEAERLRAYGTGTPSDRPPVGIPEAFAARVREHPDAPAVRRGADTLTYSQLDAAAEQTAHRLRQAGLRPGSYVAVPPGRDLSTPAVLLGVWKAGAAWLPLDPATPTGQLGDAARDAGADALLVPTGDGSDGRPAGAVDVVVLPGRPAGAVPGASHAAAAGPDSAACVLPSPRATAGGGVVISHRALAYALQSLRTGLAEGYPAAGRDPVWLSTGASTAAAVAELLLPMTVGGRVVLGPQPTPEDAAELTAILDTGVVTHLQLTPLAAEQVLTAGLPPTTTIIGGDPITGGDTLACLGPAGAGTVVPADGVDEIPGWLAFGGRPLPDVTLSVLDERLRPVPIGVGGELCVSGPLIPDGYLGDPARTAAHFVPDPTGHGARLFRTGRRARFGEDGRLEQFGPIGRAAPNVDALDLSRICDVLRAQPSVRDAYVLVSPDLPDGRNLVGYVRPVDGEPFDAAGVRRSSAGRLPRRLVPDLLIRVDAWPLTRRGTLDEDRLPRPEEIRAAPEQPTPWDDTFETLLRSLLPFLATDDALSPDLELAGAGLDSLSTVELLASLEDAYDIVIPEERLVLDMFETAGTLWAEVSGLCAAYARQSR